MFAMIIIKLIMKLAPHGPHSCQGLALTAYNIAVSYVNTSSKNGTVDTFTNYEIILFKAQK